MNGGTGVGTVPGPDIVITLPSAVFSFNDVLGEHFDFNADDGMTNLYKEELDLKLLSDAVKTEFSNAGHPLSGTATVKAISYGSRWRITDGANVYEVIAVGPTELDVTVSDVVNVDLDSLGANPTVQDAFDLINSATGGEVTYTVVADPASGLAAGFRFDYGGIPGGAAPMYSIKAVGDSPAAGDLGIFSQDTNGAGVVTGSINTRSLSDRFFITENSHVSLSAGLLADEMEISASFGGLGLAIVNGDLNVALDTGISLVDPGTGVNDDGRLTLREIFENPIGDVLDFQTPTITGGGRLPLIGQSEGFDINGVLGIDPNHPYTEYEDVEQPIPIEDGPEIHISITSNPFNIDVTTNDQFDEIISGFENFTFDSICGAVQQIIELIRSADIDILNEELPLINKSVNDLIAVDGALQTIIDVLCADPTMLRNQVQDLVDDLLDKPTAPIGAIPAIYPQLNTQQRALITELHDAMLSALGAANLTSIPSLLSGVVAGFESLIDELNTDGINTSQLSSVIGQISALLPRPAVWRRRSRTRWGSIRAISYWNM